MSVLARLAAAAVAAAALVGGSGAPQAAGDPVVVAAGDIACDPADRSFKGGAGTPTACRQASTAALLGGATAVLPIGDLQYDSGTAAAFAASYDPTWGAQKAITHPVVGNHEYGSPNAAPYFAYFGAAAGDPAKGYYSYDLGSWHLIALNSECAHVACAARSPQEQWLRSDLAATNQPCILAYWHRARFSSAPHGNDAAFDGFWRALYAYGADVVLVGHDHVYERFALQNPDAQADPAGIRQFVVGMGGHSHYAFAAIRANSEVRNNTTFGVLKLTLHPGSYDWEFVPESGGAFTDGGTTACHVRPSAVAVAGFAARRVAAGAVLVRWRSAGEPQILGFNLYRQRADRSIRLNRRLIAAGRGWHAWLDAAAPRGRLIYRLEAVSVSGGRRTVASLETR